MRCKYSTYGHRVGLTNFDEALFLSPKNSVDGSLSVLEAVDCNTWVKAQEAANSPMVSQMLEKRAVKVLEMPSLEELLDAASVDPYPYTKTFEEAANDPFCYLHTSGTTGPPKPIPWSHGLIGTMDAVRLLPPVEGDNGLLPWTSDWKDGDSIYSSFPMSHVSHAFLINPACTVLIRIIGRWYNYGYSHARLVWPSMRIRTSQYYPEYWTN